MMAAAKQVKKIVNRRYAHSITRTKNDQLSVDGAKLDGSPIQKYGKQMRLEQ